MSYKPETETALLEVLRAMREDPDKYTAVRRSIAAASSDEERVRAVLNFAETENDLAALMPSRGTEVGLVTATTVTVTTVLVLEGEAEAPGLPPVGDFPEPDPEGPRPA